MLRADLLGYLAETFSEITDELGHAETDTVPGYKYPMDLAFLRLGVSESALATATVATDLIEPAWALGEYYSLRRFLTKVASRQDYADGQQAKSLSRTQLFRQIQDLLKEAAERAATLGYSVTGGVDYRSAVLSLDFLEPEVLNG